MSSLILALSLSIIYNRFAHLTFFLNLRIKDEILQFYIVLSIMLLGLINKIFFCLSKFTPSSHSSFFLPFLLPFFICTCVFCLCRGIHSGVVEREGGVEPDPPLLECSPVSYAALAQGDQIS